MNPIEPPLRRIGQCTYDPKFRLSPALAVEVMRQLRVNPLLSDVADEDFNNLAMLVMARRAEEPLFGHNRGKSLRSPLFKRCKVLAADAVARTWERGTIRQRHLIRGYYRGLQKWGDRIMSLAKQRLEGTPLLPGQSQVLDAFLNIIGTCGVRRDFEQFSRAAGEALGSLAQESGPDDRLVAQVMFFQEGEERAGGMFLSTCGEAFLGFRQVRDSHSKTFEIPRPKRDAPKAIQSKVDADDTWEVEDRATGTPLEALEALEAIEQVQQIRSIARERRRGAEPGSPKFIVLENFEQLISGTVSIRSLASASGVSRTALGDILTRERASIARQATKKTNE